MVQPAVVTQLVMLASLFCTILHMGHGPSSVPRWTGRHNEARSSARRIAKVFPLGAVRHRHPFRPAAEYPGKDRTVRDGRRTSWHGIVSKAGTRPSSKVKARPEGRNQTSEDFPFRPRAESISIGGMDGSPFQKTAVSWAFCLKPKRQLPHGLLMND